PGTDPRLAAAARELFEETGVLIARRADGSLPDGTRPWDPQRRLLLEDRLHFSAFLAAESLRLDAADFLPAAPLLTPASPPARLHTSFFVARLAAGPEAVVWPGELDRGFWTTPTALLDTWTRGEILVAPPTVSLLELLRGRPATDLPALLAPSLRALEAGAIPPIWFAPGVQMVPLRTAGLPPSSYTNAYLVGSGTVYLLDPGPHEADEQTRLFEAIDARLADGVAFAAVVLTHHHPDHVAGAAAV